ncbi:MAG: hypothetical protein V3S78_05345 [Hyphomicrobium sp.]
MRGAKQGDYVRTKGTGHRIGHVTGYSRFTDYYHIQWRVSEPSKTHKRDDFITFADQVQGKSAWAAQYESERDSIARTNMEG